MNDLVTTNDGWNDAAAEAAARVVRGTLPKFNDWRWFRGKEAEPVEKDTRLVAIGTAAAWASGRQAGGIPDAASRQAAARSRRAWQHRPDKLGAYAGRQNARDPWQSTRFVYLVDPDTAEAFTFSTSSFGGHEAVRNLADSIARVRSAHPNALPVVSLEAAPMHTKYGRKSKPVFKIVDWKATGSGVWDAQLPPPEPLGFDDEIGF